MGDVTLAARVILGCVFALAAVAKLLARDSSRVSFDDFGVSPRIASLTEPLLVPAELAVAASLLFQPTARLGALGATLLLLIFTGAVANALRNGRRPQCGCFGGLHAEPIGKSTLVRNGLLAVLAMFTAATGPGTGLGRWLSTGGHIAVTVGLGAVALAALLTAARLRPPRAGSDPQGTVQPAVAKGPSCGQQAPVFALAGACGPHLSLDSLTSDDRPLLLIFGDAGCGACASLFRRLAIWQTTVAERVRIAVIGFGGLEQTREICTEHHVQNVLVDPDGSAWRAYGVLGSPMGFAIGADQRILAGPALGPDTIEDLMRLTLARGREATTSLAASGREDPPSGPNAPRESRIAVNGSRVA